MTTLSPKSNMDRISNLPTEIAIHIVGSMRLPDMLTMRLVSQHWNALITSPSSQRAIARHYLRQGFLPSVVLKLYPPPKDPDLEYLAGLWYRFDISCQLVSFLIQTTSTTYPRRHGTGRSSTSTATDLDLERFHSRQTATAHAYATRCPAAAFAAVHLLEEYRHRIEASSSSINDINADHNHNRDVSAILSHYDDNLLRGVHHFGVILPMLIHQVLAYEDRLPEGEDSTRVRFHVPERVKLHLLWLGGIPALVKAMHRAGEEGDKGRRAVYEWHRGLREHLGNFQGNVNVTSDMDMGSGGVTGQERQGLFKHPRPGHGLPRIAPGLENRPMVTTMRVSWVAVSGRKLRERGLLGPGMGLNGMHMFKTDGVPWMRSDLAKPLEEMFRGSHFEEMMKEAIWKVV